MNHSPAVILQRNQQSKGLMPIIDEFIIVSSFCYDASHEEDGEECWCAPDVEELEDGCLLITHHCGVC